jgi:hypothetical protein
MTLAAELTVAAEAEWLDGWTAGPTEDQGSGLSAGAKAPDLALADHTGNERLLSEFWAGQPALLMFWRHFGCGFGVHHVSVSCVVNDEIQLLRRVRLRAGRQMLTPLAPPLIPPAWLTLILIITASFDACPSPALPTPWLRP